MATVSVTLKTNRFVIFNHTNLLNQRRLFVLFIIFSTLNNQIIAINSNIINDKDKILSFNDIVDDDELDSTEIMDSYFKSKNIDNHETDNNNNDDITIDKLIKNNLLMTKISSKINSTGDQLIDILIERENRIYYVDQILQWNQTSSLKQIPRYYYTNKSHTALLTNFHKSTNKVYSIGNLLALHRCEYRSQQQSAIFINEIWQNWHYPIYKIVEIFDERQESSINDDQSVATTFTSDRNSTDQLRQRQRYERFEPLTAIYFDCYQYQKCDGLVCTNRHESEIVVIQVANIWRQKYSTSIERRQKLLSQPLFIHQQQSFSIEISDQQQQQKQSPTSCSYIIPTEYLEYFGKNELIYSNEKFMIIEQFAPRKLSNCKHNFEQIANCCGILCCLKSSVIIIESSPISVINSLASIWGALTIIVICAIVSVTFCIISHIINRTNTSTQYKSTNGSNRLTIDKSSMHINDHNQLDALVHAKRTKTNSISEHYLSRKKSINY